MSDNKIFRISLRVFSIAAVAAYTVACIYMYYRFMGWESGSVYESDLPAHISLAVDEGLVYSLISIMFISLSMLDCMGAVPYILGGFALLSVVFSYYLLEEITEYYGRKWDKGAALFASLILNLLMPCYIRGLSDGRYMGMHTSSIWHNSTYLLMKWMGLLVIYIYVRLERNIAKELTAESYLYFLIVMTLTTAAKPNFFLAVSPAMLIFLIADIVKKKAPLSRLLLFASSVIPSFFVMYFQNSALYSANAGDNRISIAPGRAMSVHTGYLIPVCILSIAFPLMVLVMNIGKLKKDPVLLFAWIAAGTGFLQYFLFSEEGARNMDANFSWGYAFTIILIFGVSLIYWCRDVKDVFLSKAEKSRELTIKRICTAFCGAVLIYHAYCGILFFVRIASGVSYMMWG